MLKLLLTAVLFVCCFQATAQQSQPAAPKSQPQQLRNKSDGERAFEANCSRCHTAPEQLAPRITGSALVHMRVRASLSAADERALLNFLAP